MGTPSILERLTSLRAQAAALVTVVFVTYLPTIGGGFLWDDNENIVKAAALRGIHGLWRIWVEPGATVQYYPLTHTSFWLEFQAWGLNPLPYHLGNIALHTGSAFLLWVLLRRLQVPGALLGAVIWAVHPLQAESVAWIIERKNCLSGVFAVGSLLAYEGFQRTQGKTRWKAYAGALVLYSLALYSKTAVVGIPVVMLAIAWWKYPAREKWVGRLASLTPFAILSVAAGVTTGLLEVHFLQASGPEFSWTPLQRVFIASHALWFYLAKNLAPVGLMFIYPQWDINPSRLEPWGYVAATLAGVVLLVALRRRVPRGLVAAVVSYVALIAPALGLTNLYFMRFAFAQNHFQYFASAAVCAAVGAALWKLGEKVGERSPNLKHAALGLVVAAMSAGCIYQGRAFVNSETLYLVAIRNNPDAWMAHYNLSLDLLKKGRKQEAAWHLGEVLRLRPDDTNAMLSLGAALAEQQRYEEAAMIFERVLQKQTANPDAHFNLALVRDRLGDSAKAAFHLRQALAAKPDWPRGQRMLAWILATDPEDSVRNGQEAVALASQACAKTKKTLARCLDTLAAAYAESGRFDMALATADRAVQEALAAGEQRKVGVIKARREAYEAGIPYRRKPGAPSEE